ncbi:hypothetical protein [Cupriavidus pauculus]|uniref:Uncharacterized protein n=1 Tax=Cupriavidus pauculus TaxID=82633 RepID=A0A2N5C6F4_9BURK|nr:hypothetical protein [Cupriavidus pauculus]PLP97811.1 hypothetical protein CYJ10_25360 [Cupriavidus pauculus]
MSIAMTADQFSDHPGSGHAGPAPQHRAKPHHDWRIAATIFTAVFIALGGIFAILEYSGRQSDKTNENIYYRFDAVDERLGVMDRQFQAADKRFDGVDRRIDRLEAKVDEGFAKVDQRFEKVDERFDKMDERFNKLEARFDRKFDQIEKNFDQINENFAQVTDVLQTLVEQKAPSGAAASDQARGSRPR